MTPTANERKIFFFSGENYPRPLVCWNERVVAFISISLLLAYISNGKVMGWGNKAIEIRNVHSATLDGVFMHKRAQKLK